MNHRKGHIIDCYNYEDRKKSKIPSPRSVASRLSTTDLQTNMTSNISSLVTNCSLIELCDIITDRYHLTLLAEIGRLRAELHEMNTEDTTKTYTLYEIIELFSKSADILKKHIAEEGEIVFPYIKHNARVQKSGYKKQENATGISHDQVVSLILTLLSEGHFFDQISELSINYENAVNMDKKQKMILIKLRKFERHLYEYTEIMINQLYPKVLDLINKQND